MSRHATGQPGSYLYGSVPRRAIQTWPIREFHHGSVTLLTYKCGRLNALIATSVSPACCEMNVGGLTRGDDQRHAVTLITRSLIRQAFTQC